VAYTESVTHAKIVQAERQAMLKKLHAVLDPQRYDNVLDEDKIEVIDKPYLGSSKPVTVFRARKDGAPVALILTPIAPDGYNGEIKLLVGIDTNGTVTGVRVISHRETPGLGDAIEERRGDWIKEFNNKSLQQPDINKWRVKRDSGVFDQFTGATITPRAIVKAVKNTLIYVQRNQQKLFQQPASQTNTLASHK
jgi:electron transport complex protein RnfG